MHYKTYEWTLYVQQNLSQRMQIEMENHLESCDECMSSYLEALGESLDHDEAELPSVKTNRPLKERWINRFQQGLRPVNLAAVLLICLALLGFTPQGKIVLAQIRSQLESIGGALSEMIGLPADSDYIQNVGEIQNVEITDESGPDDVARSEEFTDTQLEIKLDQVLVEQDRFSYSILAAGEALDGAKVIRVYDKIEIAGLQPLSSGGGSSTPLASDPSVLTTYMTYSMPENLFDHDETLPVKITIFSMDIFGDLGSRRIEGPWMFEFDVSRGRLMDETRLILLQRTITIDKAVYDLEQLILNPIQPRLKVFRQRELQAQVFSDPDTTIGKGNLMGFVLRTDDGSEFHFSAAQSSSDSLGAWIEYEADGEQFDALLSAKTIRLMPYISKKGWQVTSSGVAGYFPLVDQAFEFEVDKINQQ